MNLIGQLSLIAFVVWVVFVPRRGFGGGKSLYWYAYSRHQWSLLELVLTMIVGTLPIGVVAVLEPASRSFLLDTAGIAIVCGLVLSFIGAALGLTIAKGLHIQRIGLRLLCLLLGWMSVVALIAIAKYAHERGAH